MRQTYFITGYPGFLARNLIHQLVTDYQQDLTHIYLLVLPNLREKAIEEITYFAKSKQLNQDLFTIIPGDITSQNLGIDHNTNHQLQASVTHVFHLAAIYDLAVPKIIALKINVNGTNHVNNWVKTMNNLKRYVYFSTAFVSGTREGRVYEHELIAGPMFRNHYEQTKYEAEILVEKLKTDVPTTIIRPGIVRGHSKTGETIKFDGIYFTLNLFDHLRFLPTIPYLGEGNVEGNFVPSDYVLQATSYLATAPIGVGKTYHLTDPNPYTMRELYKMISEAYLGKTPKGEIPHELAKIPLYLAPIRKWLRVEKEAMDYFTIRSSYDASNTVRDLEGTGIACPDLQETLEPMLAFYRKYKHDPTRHILIS